MTKMAQLLLNNISVLCYLTFAQFYIKSSMLYINLYIYSGCKKFISDKHLLSLDVAGWFDRHRYLSHPLCSQCQCLENERPHDAA